MHNHQRIQERGMQLHHAHAFSPAHTVCWKQLMTKCQKIYGHEMYGAETHKTNISDGTACINARSSRARNADIRPTRN